GRAGQAARAAAGPAAGQRGLSRRRPSTRVLSEPGIRPGAEPFTERTPRVAAARRLTRRDGRAEAGRFLAEGAQAVREALAWGQVRELFVTAAAAGRNPELVEAAETAGVPVSEITEKAAAGISETVTPQGLVAVCDLVDRPLPAALAHRPTLVTVLV